MRYAALILACLAWCGGCGDPSEPAGRESTIYPVRSYEEIPGLSAPGESDKLASGVYYKGDRLSENTDLTLRADGNYVLTTYGCQGVAGSSAGKWSAGQGKLLLDPALERGAFREHSLRRLDVLVYRGKPILVPENDRPAFLRQGPCAKSCFVLENRVSGF